MRGKAYHSGSVLGALVAKAGAHSCIMLLGREACPWLCGQSINPSCFHSLPGRVKTSKAPIHRVKQGIPIRPDLLEDEEIILKFNEEKRTDLEAVIKCHMLVLTH